MIVNEDLRLELHFLQGSHWRVTSAIVLPLLLSAIMLIVGGVSLRLAYYVICLELQGAIAQPQSWTCSCNGQIEYQVSCALNVTRPWLLRRMPAKDISYSADTRFSAGGLLLRCAYIFDQT